MSIYHEEWMNIGYKKAQKKIATNLLLNDHKTTFVSEVTELPLEEVEKIKIDHSPKIRKIIRNMMNEGISEYTIARLLQVPVEIVFDVRDGLFKLSINEIGTARLDTDPRIRLIIRQMLKNGMEEDDIARLVEVPIEFAIEVRKKMVRESE
ncbi:hypothetical protein HPT25_03995 [Bacillus sp. BRMEA1]|uniref:hypothetical protein n=1 Tax=Neobacillus endophyticus TaxID=2738405 RepID=UPI00156466E1|nr:hypothetical protein [Neobacillus endophyticus]NRD76651.1 hypothetical protein [Neobacillus endophyticus]